MYWPLRRRQLKICHGVMATSFCRCCAACPGRPAFAPCTHTRSHLRPWALAGEHIHTHTRAVACLELSSFAPPALCHPACCATGSTRVCFMGHKLVQAVNTTDASSCGRCSEDQSLFCGGEGVYAIYYTPSARALSWEAMPAPAALLGLLSTPLKGEGLHTCSATGTRASTSTKRANTGLQARACAQKYMDAVKCASKRSQETNQTKPNNNALC